MALHEIPAAAPRRHYGMITLVILLLLVLLGARSIATYVIEYNWWREMDQVQTWIALLMYSLAPVAPAVQMAPSARRAFLPRPGSPSMPEAISSFPIREIISSE